MPPHPLAWCFLPSVIGLSQSVFVVWFVHALPATPRSAQDLLTPSSVLRGKLGGSYGISEIEPSLATCKATTLPTVLLSYYICTMYLITDSLLNAEQNEGKKRQKLEIH